MQSSLRNPPNPFSVALRALTLGLAALVIGAGPGSAQDRTDEDPTVVILGKVVDAETGQPLHGAFVSRGGDSGFLTHEDGSFALRAWPFGVYRLTIQLLGYETLQLAVPGPEPEPLLVRLAPDPIQLEGLTVLVDRLERRRKRVTVAVRAFDREDLLRAPPTDVVDWVKGRTGLVTTFCASGGRPAVTLASLGNGSFMDEGQECVMRRGRWVRPTVYIDEVRSLRGLEELRSFRPQDLYTVEVYDRGTVVYAYTPRFVERVLKGRRFLTPVIFTR